MLLRFLNRVLAPSLLAACAMLAGCGGSSTTTPSTPANSTVTGTWRGTGTDAVEGSQFTWVLVQDGSNNVTGSTSFLGVRSSFNATGPISGSVAGQVFTFSFTLDFAAPFQFCKVTANGSAQVTSTSLTGSYTGTNSCEGGPFSRGQFTLTKQ